MLAFLGGAEGVGGCRGGGVVAEITCAIMHHTCCAHILT